jgi:hypothetical protein
MCRKFSTNLAEISEVQLYEHKLGDSLPVTFGVVNMYTEFTYEQL